MTGCSWSGDVGVVGQQRAGHHLVLDVLVECDIDLDRLVSLGSKGPSEREPAFSGLGSDHRATLSRGCPSSR